MAKDVKADIADDTSQDDSTDDKDVTSSADETLLTEEEVSDDTILQDDKDDADKTADDDADDAEDTESDDADGDGEAEPVDYNSLKVPDGMEIDEKSLGEFKDVAAKMNDGNGLSIEDAQILVDFRAEMVKNSLAEWENKFSEWRGELLSDKEIGGDTFKEVTVPNVIAAVERYGDKETVALFQTNKMYGENPLLVRMLNRVGETLRADQHARGGRAAGSDSEEAKLRRMYPSHYNEDGTLKDSAKGAPA
jgi:hypothetical protein